MIQVRGHSNLQSTARSNRYSFRAGGIKGETHETTESLIESIIRCGYIINPYCPSNLLCNPELTATLNENQKKALLIFIFLADIEQILHYFFVDTINSIAFSSFMVYPHDTVTYSFVCFQQPVTFNPLNSKLVFRTHPYPDGREFSRAKP